MPESASAEVAASVGIEGFQLFIALEVDGTEIPRMHVQQTLSLRNISQRERDICGLRLLRSIIPSPKAPLVLLDAARPTSSQVTKLVNHPAQAYK